MRSHAHVASVWPHANSIASEKPCNKKHEEIMKKTMKTSLRPSSYHPAKTHAFGIDYPATLQTWRSSPKNACNTQSARMWRVARCVRPANPNS
eukprot:352550-Chlamydomonas_euryale.AAC.21